MNEELFWAYCDQFYGYGNWNAPIWFIGIEEGGVTTRDQAQARMEAWNDTGRGHLKDLPAQCAAIQALEQEQPLRWFRQGAGPQPTWKQLIRLLLQAQGGLRADPAEQEQQILNFQQNQWGRTTGGVCDLSLFPLPCNGTRDFNRIYGQGEVQQPWLNLVCLQNRNRYQNAFVDRRTAFLQQRWAIAQPTLRLVVIYAWSQRQLFERLIGGNPENIDMGDPWQDDWQTIPHFEPIGGVRPRVLVIRHPTPHNIPVQILANFNGNWNAALASYFQSVGTLIRDSNWLAA